MAPEMHFGFLLIPLQLLDMCGPMDILSGTQTAFLSAVGYPESITSKGSNLVFHYIGCERDGASPMTTSTGAQVMPNCTIYDCPKLDYLLIGGPDPKYIQTMPADVQKFIVDRATEVETLFTTCTGGLVLASTGLLDGRDACTNHVVVKMHPELFPQVKWNLEKNWVVSDDDKFWTGAGAVAGMDMVAHWVRRKFGDGVWQASCALLDYQPRDINGKFIAVH